VAESFTAMENRRPSVSHWRNHYECDKEQLNCSFHSEGVNNYGYFIYRNFKSSKKNTGYFTVLPVTY
jgi:hypothetical protein